MTQAFKISNFSLWQLRCAFHNDGRENHYSCPSFPEVHFDRDMSSSDMCAIVVNNIEEHHEGKQADHSALCRPKTLLREFGLSQIRGYVMQH